MIDTIKVELPNTRKECALNWNVVADLPAKAFGGGGSGYRPLTVLHEGLPLIVGHHDFGIDLAFILNIDRDLGKEVTFILIDAAKPVSIGDLLYAGNFQDTLAI